MFKFQIEFKYPIPISKTLTLGTLGPSGTKISNQSNWTKGN